MVRARVVNGGIARVFAGATALASVTGCYDVKSVDPGILVLPDKTGRVDATKNPLGIQGEWYAYGDSYDTQSCLRFGKHGDLCSQVHWPPPSKDSASCDESDLTYTTFPLGFPNQNGVMCTEGQVGLVVNCGPDVLNCAANSLDYSNMWGAGIGLDFNLDVSSGKRDPTSRKPWDAETHGIAGVAFDFQLIDDGGLGKPHLRVEFPIVMRSDSGQELTLPSGKSAVSLDPCAPPVMPPDEEYPGAPNPPSEEHPDGSPFWDAPSVYTNGLTDISPVRAGHNEIRWSEVHKAPGADYDFRVTELLGIQFHVSSYNDANQAAGGHFGYGFCISNLTFLRE